MKEKKFQANANKNAQNHHSKLSNALLTHIKEGKLQDRCNVLLCKNMHTFPAKYILIVSLTSAIIRQKHYSQSLSRISTRPKHTFALKDNYLNSGVSTHSLLYLFYLQRDFGEKINAQQQIPPTVL